MIEKLKQAVNECNYIVFFGGAGVSTESGIPDFRSTDGLYNQKYKYPPETIVSHSFFEYHTDEFYEFYKDKMIFPDAEPNAAHKKLAQLEEEGKLKAVITQNIDGLHQKAGSRKVKEIHGSALRSYCVSCRKEYGRDYIFENEEEIPHCPKCGKMVRPDVTLYGELLPEPAYEEAIALIRYADLLIIGGTSLEVGSAAQLAHMYHGKYLVIINKGKTKLEGKADMVFHDSIGKVMKRIDIFLGE